MSELAKQLIEKEKQERTGKLDLGRCELTDLNAIPELFELEWLKELILSNEWWDYEKREWIDSQNKRGKNLLSALPPTLSNLAHLESLRIGGDYTGRWKISDIRVLEKLTALNTLDLRSNQISDYSFLEKLTALNTLDLRSNKISDIRPLLKLDTLRKIVLNDNQMNDLSGIWEFLVHQGLRIVWKEWYETRNGEINLKNNPFTTPPVEVVQQGHEAVFNYFRQLERGGGRKNNLYYTVMFF